MKKYIILFVSLPIIILSIIALSNINKNSNNNDLSGYASTNILNTKNDLTFFIASDLHYLSKKLTDNGEAFQKFFNINDGKQTNYISEIFDSFIFEIKENKPDVLVISGDLTLNGEKESHLSLASKLKEIKDIGTEVYVIPGNHDINNPWARNFVDNRQIKASTVSPKSFAKIYNDFGYSDAISRDSTSLSYLVSPSSNIYLLMLDDNNYNDNFTYNAPVMSGSLSKTTLDWILECSDLAKTNNAKLIAVSHHNFLNHSDYISDGYTLDNNTEILNTFKQCGIELAFSGHTHLQSIKNYTNDSYSLHDISNSSLAVFPQKYGILKIEENAVASYHTACLNVDSWSESLGITDNYLLNFRESSRLFYNDFVYNQNFNSLLKNPNFSIEDVKEISKTIANIRIKYDYILDDLSWDDITNSRGFELLKTCNSPYLKHYVKIATDGNEIDNNRLILALRPY